MPAPRILRIPKTTRRTEPALDRRDGAKRPSRGSTAAVKNSLRAARRPSATPAGVIPIESATDVRWSRVRAARARIASEYYERGEIRDRLVDALLSELLHSA